MKEIVVAVTGASGALYAGRLLRALLYDGHCVHLVLSKYGRYLLREELGFRPDRETLLEFLVRLYGEGITAGQLREYSVADQSSAIASGSFDTDGMVIVPCSIKTLSGIAHGHAENLIERRCRAQGAAAADSRGARNAAQFDSSEQYDGGN